MHISTYGRYRKKKSYPHLLISMWTTFIQAIIAVNTGKLIFIYTWYVENFENLKKALKELKDFKESYIICCVSSDSEVLSFNNLRLIYCNL